MATASSLARELARRRVQQLASGASLSRGEAYAAEWATTLGRLRAEHKPKRNVIAPATRL